MVEYYAITVWSFSAFYNNRKIGARGCHKAAPVSRYQSCAWSSNTGSGVMRMAYRRAMYAAFEKSRISYGSAPAGEYSTKKHKPESEYTQKINYSFVYAPQKLAGEQYLPAENVKVLKTESFVQNVTCAPAAKISDYSYGATISHAKEVGRSETVAHSKQDSPVSANNYSNLINYPAFVSNNISPQIKPANVYSPAIIPGGKNIIFENEKTAAHKEFVSDNCSRAKIIKLINSVSYTPIKGEKNQKRISPAPVLNISKNRVAVGNQVRVKNISKNKIEDKIQTPLRYRLGNGAVVSRYIVDRIISQKDAYRAVEKIVNKLKIAGKKASVNKIFEYSISYAKEKKHELRRQSLSLWRILWARVNGKLLMLIIDDASKIIVGVGVFASHKTQRAIKIVGAAIEKYGAPKAIVNYENILFSAKSCADNVCSKLENYLNGEGIEYLASILDEGAAFLRARNFIEYAAKEEDSNSFESFVNFYNLRGIKEVGGVSPALAYLESA